MKRFAMGLILLATGCASMVNGRYQQVPVDSYPSGAKVEVDCGDAKHEGGTTPTVLTLQRGADHCNIRLTKDGYSAKSIDFERRDSRAKMLNAIPGVAMGVVGAFFAAALWDIDSIDDGFKGGFAVGSTPGAAIDEHTGGSYKLEPNKVFVILTREEAP